MTTQVYRDGVLRQVWDDTNPDAMEYRTYDAEGVLVNARPYTPDEVAAVQRGEPADRALAHNQASVEQALLAHLTELQAIIAMDNTDIRNNPASMIKTMARVLRRLIRITTRTLDGTD